MRNQSHQGGVRTNMKYNAEVTELYEVSWSLNETGSSTTPSVYFESKADAERVSKLPLGWYGGDGSVYTCTYINGKGMPSKTAIYHDADSWAAETLTLNQAKKHGFFN